MKPAGDGTPLRPALNAKPTGFADIGIDQKLDTQIPADLTFRDENGTVVKLGDYYAKGKPILFTLVYYGCPRLCTMVLNEMNKALMPSSLNAGSDFEIVIVSFDPKEGPALAFDKKKEYAHAYRRPGTERGWHFLTGDEANIKALTQAIGFRYAWDEAHQQFIHAGGLMVLTPEGRTSKYFYGVEYVPRDLKLALLEAGGGKIGTTSDQVLLYCFQYDPHTGRYSVAILTIVKTAGGLTVLLLGLFMVRNIRRNGNGVAAFDVAQPAPLPPTSDSIEASPRSDAAATGQDVKDNG